MVSNIRLSWKSFHHPVVGLSADQLAAIQASGEQRLISEIYRELTARRAAGCFRCRFLKNPTIGRRLRPLQRPASLSRSRPRGVEPIARHIQSDQSRLDPTTTRDVYFSYYYSGIRDDPRVPDSSKVLLMELCVLAADARRPLGYEMAEIAAMWNWPVTQVRERTLKPARRPGTWTSSARRFSSGILVTGTRQRLKMLPERSRICQVA